jgi:hypothetical protein
MRRTGWVFRIAVGAAALIAISALLVQWWEPRSKNPVGLADLTGAPAPTVTARALTEGLAPEIPLKRVYDDHERDLDPAARALAWAAFSACVPTFIGPAGPRSPATFEEGLPDDPKKPQRLAAMQAIAARCKDFAGRPTAELMDEAVRNAERHRAGDLRSRGELALTAVKAGNSDEAVSLIRDIVARRSFTELRDLSGIVSRWHRQAPEPLDVMKDALLSVIGCDLGVDCGADSLQALQLCAFNEACEGDLAERTLAGFPDLDRDQFNRARVQLAAELREGRFDVLSFFDPAL